MLRHDGGAAVLRAVLAGETTVAEVAATHVAALGAQIRARKVTRAVPSTVARRGSSAEEMTLMNKLARLSAAERRRIIEDFMAEISEGLDTVDPDIRNRLRFAAAHQLTALVNGLEPPSAPDEEFAWVVAALKARTDR